MKHNLLPACKLWHHTIVLKSRGAAENILQKLWQHLPFHPLRFCVRNSTCSGQRNVPGAFSNWPCPDAVTTISSSSSQHPPSEDGHPEINVFIIAASNLSQSTGSKVSFFQALGLMLEPIRRELSLSPEYAHWIVLRIVFIWCLVACGF